MMASHLWFALLLAFVSVALATDGSSSSEEDDGTETLPFEIKGYESTYQEGSDEVGMMTLTIHYIAQAPFPVRWTISHNDIGMDFAALSGSRTWSQCVECYNEEWICSSSIQTSMIRALRRLTPELIYASENTVLRYAGFSPDVLDARPGTPEIGHKESLAAPFAVHSHPALKNHFDVGDDVVLTWNIDSDNSHELATVKRKTGNLFEEEVLFHHEEGADHEDSASQTEGNVVTEVTVTKTTGNMYNYVITVTIGSATADDTGVYVVSTRTGMQNWVEVLPTLTESAYPSTPVIHVQRRIMGSYFGIFCTAEGHAITEIQIRFNDVAIEVTPYEQLSVTSRTDDAWGIAYKAEPNDDKTWTDYSGTYECMVTQESGRQTVQIEEFTFTNPDKK